MTFSAIKEIYPDSTPFATNFIFTLSKEVNVQRRVVYDIFMMFGDVGGLLDFILIVFRPLLYYLSGSFMSASLISRLFHRSEGPQKVQIDRVKPLSAFLQIKPIEFSSSLTMLDACSCGFFRKKAKRIRVQAEAEK